MSNPNVAFALGGLAGNNAYGAGFLQAALNCDVKPVLITCTSGQIYWVAEYLKSLRSEPLPDSPSSSLRETFSRQLKEQTPYGLLIEEWNRHVKEWLPPVLPAVQAVVTKALEQALAVFPTPRDAVFATYFWHGKDDRFGPAWLRYTSEFVANSVMATGTVTAAALSGRLNELFLTEEWLRVWPNRCLEPRFPDSFFKEIAELFENETEIGIAFNCYDAKNGLEYIYMNSRALQLLDRQPEQQGSYRNRTFYKAITPDAVRSALWLYQYGFPDDVSLLDGAYYRGVILSEACAPSVERIYAVRPIPTEWQGALPQRFIEGKDFETEVGFNGAFAGEADKMQLIRKLANDFEEIKESSGQPLPPAVAGFFDKYHKIDVVPVELKLRRGFLDYVFEASEVFDKGFSDACLAFRRTQDCGLGRKETQTPCPLPAGQSFPLKQVA